ncbi:MAG: hypothetical protein NEA02_01665 [Thermoanaerobaculia bacterium]|nr:hypothetical protein [Thermoanaerobaculia bacterium]
MTPTPLQNGATFHDLPPCRVLDTRNASGPDAAAPVLAAAFSRVLSPAGRCGIPASATALSVNVTVTSPTAAGSLVFYPGDAAVPNASTISFGPGQTRANNTILKMAENGSATVGVFNSAPGSVHLIVDVNGYFQ